MRCPTCEFDGREHSVKALNRPMPGNPLVTEESWDRTGSHHVHNSTMNVALFLCSNGHEWQHAHIQRCPTMDCEWNLRPETRGQLTAKIPGRNETMASFRSRKITQFLKVREKFPELHLDNSGPYFGTFVLVLMPGGASLVTGQMPRRGNPTLEFIDVTDAEAVAYFSGGGKDGKAPA